MKVKSGCLSRGASLCFTLASVPLGASDHPRETPADSQVIWLKGSEHQEGQWRMPGGPATTPTFNPARRPQPFLGLRESRACPRYPFYVTLMAITWNEEQRDDIVIATLSGEFDLRASRDMEPTFQKHIQAKTPALLLDFNEVAFIDSSGIACLITYFRESKEFGGRLALANVRAPIQNVFNLVSLGTFFPIYDDVETALTSMRSAA